jgi:hypothetical protein
MTYCILQSILTVTVIVSLALTSQWIYLFQFSPILVKCHAHLNLLDSKTYKLHRTSLDKIRKACSVNRAKKSRKAGIFSQYNGFPQLIKALCWLSVPVDPTCLNCEG